MKRITTIVGAGAVLDLELPKDAIWPSTENITNAIRGVKKQNILTHKEIVEVEEIYQILKREYPTYPNFELIFHVLEMFVAYGWVWQHPTSMPKATSMFPVFAPFTAPKWLYDRSNVTAAEFKKYIHWLAENHINRTIQEPDRFVTEAERATMEKRKLELEEYRNFARYLAENNINRTFYC